MWWTDAVPGPGGGPCPGARLHRAGALDYGFDAIQFNLVFESNPARRLYEELGWREIGRVPQAVDGEDARHLLALGLRAAPR